MTIQSIIPLAAAIIYLILLVVISFNKPWQRQQKYFMLYLAAMVVWEISDSLLLSDLAIDYKIVFFKVLICTSLLWVIQLYLFVRAFLGLPMGFGVWVGYSFLILLVLLAALGLAPTAVHIEDGVFTGPEYGWWFGFFVFPLVFLSAMGTATLVKKARIQYDPEERNKFSYLVIAVILLVIFGFFGVTPIALIGGIPVSHLGSLLTAFVLAYAISRHGLVSINSVLRSVVGWAILFIVAISFYAIILYVFHFVFDFELSFKVLFFSTVTAIIVTIFVYRLRPMFSLMVDYFFYRETYTYRQILQRFDTEMGNIISLDELAEKMLSSIVYALRTPRALLLFQNVGTGYYTTRYIYPPRNDPSANELVIAPDNPILNWMNKESEPLNINQIDNNIQFGGLWMEEKASLTNSGLEMFCPLKSRGELVGILALEKKRSKKMFSQEDLEMIKSITGKAGIVIENARMVTTLQQQRNQVQQLLSESIHAQEEERQRISIDLHDSVAQWLAGASYQAQTVEAMLETGNGEAVREQITLVEDTIERSLKELRRVVVDLRPPALDELGLAHSLKQSMSVLSNEGIICTFKEEGTPVRLPDSVEITAYRVVQEALTNIRKHAGATHVDVSLEFLEDNLEVKIKDNGRGFDLTTTIENALSVGSLGLLGMNKRVEMLNGTFEIKTRDGGGTTIIMTLPLQSEIEESQDE